MSIYQRRNQAFLAAFWLTLMAAIWFFFAPVDAGGQATYVIVNGQSMEPNMHLGDLVIVRKESAYQIGDVVAYQNAEIDRYVIHRIIDKKNGHYILKGDNNAWIDGYEPMQQEVLGKMWLHLPKVGSHFQKLREPIYMALFAGIVSSMVAGMLFVSRKQETQNMEKKPQQTKGNILNWLMGLRKTISFRNLNGNLTEKRREVEADTTTSQNPGRKSRQHRAMMETFFSMLVVIFFLSILLCILAFTRPASQGISDDINYQQLGFFAYSAPAPAGVYDSETIQSGDPIFPSLTCSINVSFNYTLIAEMLEHVGGSYQLNAVLAHPQSGWQRTIPLQGQTPFTGSAFNTQAALNLCEIVGLVESVEQITNVRAGIYTLSVIPQVQISALVSGRSLETIFEPALVFQYDRALFYLAGQNDGADPLNPSEASFLYAQKNVPNTLAFFGTELNVPALRTIAVIGLVLSLIGLAVFWLQLETIAQTDQGAFLRLKYDPLVIDVQEHGTRQNGQTIDVNSIDDLAKLAEKHNTLIMHRAQDNAENYFVNINGLSYIYSQFHRNPAIVSNSINGFGYDLKHALDRGELQVHYQPIVSLANGQVTAVEALLRWQHPQRGMIPAGDFIQMAESTGEIGRLDEWVMQVACTQLKGWRDAGHDLKLAINLSNYSLERELVEFIQRVLQSTGTDPNWLQIEIPEGKMNRPERTVFPKLQKLKEMGIHITIDDFVGEVGLSSISQMPVSGVKIDRLLVKKTNNPEEAAAMQRIIAVATALGLGVVGKGVETNEEKTFLANAGSQAQGFLLGRPAPANEIAGMLQQSAKSIVVKSRKKSLG